ncbi:MAG: L,D-transpeptidase [Firmicutes bacterium]|nr:L,D-transpeptidase [Bacillota bacterium]
MRRLVLIVLTTLAVSSVVVADFFIDINIPEYKLRLYYENKLVETYTIAVGKSITPSILGDFKIINVVKDPTWYPKGQEPIPPGNDNPLGPWWLGLDYPGYGIHGNNSPSSIGKAQSAGCIRMNNEDVTYLASIISKGTPVRLRYDVFLASYKRDLFQVAVYPDVYALGVNTAENLRSFVLGYGEKVESKDWVLNEFIKYSNKKLYSLPEPIDVFINNTQKDAGYRIVSDYAIPIDALEEQIAIRSSGGSYYIDGRKVKTTESSRDYAYLSILEEAFWLGAKVDGTISMDLFTAYFNDRSIGRVLKKKGFLFNASIIAQELGSSLYLNPKLQAAMIDGQIVINPVFYNDDLYLTRAQLADYFALGVRFNKDEKVAFLESLPVYYEDIKLGLDGYLYNSKAYIPLLTLELIDADIEWVDSINERIKVNGVILKANKARGSNFYISVTDYLKVTGKSVVIESAGIYLGEPKDTGASASSNL